MWPTLAFLAFLAAVEASPIPMPQAITSAVTPSGTTPLGCQATFSGSFGIAVKNISTPASPVKRQANQIADGQPQVQTMAPVSMAIDGQIQAGMHTMVVMPIAQSTDGQAQAVTTMAAVTQFSDGQPQLPTISIVPVSQLSDAQPQSPITTTAQVVSQISDAQPQQASATATVASNQPSQTPTGTSTTAEATSSAVSGNTMVVCDTNGTLALSLDNGIISDSHGRTGYIASNYQFQFDSPPQAGALLTAGFSVCGNHSLALGGSTTFYQCLSGDFSNLYNTNWAPQCSPVTLNTVTLVQCSS